MRCVVITVFLFLTLMPVFSRGETLKIESIYPSRVGTLSVEKNAFLATDGISSVGIGTTSPAGKLTIAGQGDGIMSGSASVGLENTVSGAKWQWHVSDQGYLDLYDYSAGAAKGLMKFIPGNGPAGRIVVDGTTGRVGISNVNWLNPSSLLDVTGNMTVGVNYAGAVSAPVNGMIIEGNVGIGTNTPYYKLDVAGTIMGDNIMQRSGTQYSDPGNAVATKGYVDGYVGNIWASFYLVQGLVITDSNSLCVKVSNLETDVSDLKRRIQILESH